MHNEAEIMSSTLLNRHLVASVSGFAAVSQSGTNTCRALTSHGRPPLCWDSQDPALGVRAGQGGKGHGVRVSRPALGSDQRL